MDIIPNINKPISFPITKTFVDEDQEMDGAEEEEIESESPYSEETRRNSIATIHMEINKTIDDDSSPGLNLEEGFQFLTFHEYLAKINYIVTGLVTEWILMEKCVCDEHWRRIAGNVKIVTVILKPGFT